MVGGVNARGALAERRNWRYEALMEIRIYFEGNKALRNGFESFFTELNVAARSAQSTLQFIAAKDGISAYRKAERTHEGAWNILLKDSEEPIPERPADLCEMHGIDLHLVDSVFWMVELMEAWFLAMATPSPITMAMDFA